MSTNQKTISAEQDRAYEALKLATLNILDVTSANTNEETKRYAIRRAEQLVTRAKKLLVPDVKKAEISFTCYQAGSLTPPVPSIRPDMKFTVDVKGVTDRDGFAKLVGLGDALKESGDGEENKHASGSDLGHADIISMKPYSDRDTVKEVLLEGVKKGFQSALTSHWKRKSEEAQAKLDKQTATLKNTLEQLSKVEALVCDARMGTVCLEHNLNHKLKMNPQVKKPPSVNLWYAFTAIADEKDALKAALAES